MISAPDNAAVADPAQLDVGDRATPPEQLTVLNLRPMSFDLTAHYEAKSGFSITPSLRRSLDELADRYSRLALMTGKHSGKPALHTDIRGISVGTRIEVSRLVFRPSAQARVLAETFRLFVETAQRGVTSGPIRRIILNYRKADRWAQPRAAAKAAFAKVFGCGCCFLSTYHTLKHKHIEIGRTVVHQTLLQHLWETGPYHSCHQASVEAVTNELQSQPGRYENHRFFVEPIARPGQLPKLRFCYSGNQSDILVETAMRRKTDVLLSFIDGGEVAARSSAFVSLSDYEQASRRFGKLWVMQDDLVRALERQRASVFFLFLDEVGHRPTNQWLTWQQLHERQKNCPHINRASRNSASFLDMSLEELVKSEFILRDKDRYALNPQFDRFQHVTFYELGLYDKRLD